MAKKSATRRWDGDDPDAAIEWLLEFGGSATFREEQVVVETSEVMDDDGNVTVTEYEVKRPARIVYLHQGTTVQAVAGDTLRRTLPED